MNSAVIFWWEWEAIPLQAFCKGLYIHIEKWSNGLPLLKLNRRAPFCLFHVQGSSVPLDGAAGLQLSGRKLQS